MLELEELVQTEAVRKKLKHLDHLPATGAGSWIAYEALQLRGIQRCSCYT